MGLLDEAIRDHLELKRRRGADPTDVARAEREALEPVFPDEPLPEDASSPPVGEFDDVLYAEPPVEQSAVAAHGGMAPLGSDPLPEAEAEQPIAMGEETAELDMQAFLDADARMAEAEPQAPEQIPGQERLTFE